MTRERHRRDRGPASFPGAGLLLFGALALFGACGPSREAAPLPEAERARALGLAEGASVHRVVLGGRGTEEHLVPALVVAVPGDAVEFETVDHRIHTLTFPTDSLSPPMLAFLDAGGWREAPPLVNRGSRFLLLLEGAPPGRYLFLSEGHGGRAGGVIEVLDPHAAPPPGGG